MAKLDKDAHTIVRKCRVCQTVIETFNVAHENMMLSSKGKVLCPVCGQEQPELRELDNREYSRAEELRSIPRNPAGWSGVAQH
jgi:uncharacterized Zn finger protein (UPF0148 family)